MLATSSCTGRGEGERGERERGVERGAQKIPGIATHELESSVSSILHKLWKEKPTNIDDQNGEKTGRPDSQWHDPRLSIRVMC